MTNSMNAAALERAQIEKFQAETKAFESEAIYNQEQTARLLRVKADEEASLDAQRVYDFVTDVNEVSVHRALVKLSEWRAKSKAPITVRFNTGGGDVISGMALYDYLLMLAEEGVQVTTIAFGLAASMGAILLQAGTVRRMSPGAWLMIHEVSSFSEGKLSDIEDETKWLIRAQDSLLDILALRSSLSKSEIKRKWRPANGWWMRADEALQYGFIDEIARTV